MKNKWIFPAGLVIAVLLALYFYTKYRVAPDIKLETLNLTDLNGQQVNLQSFKGKKILVCFGASWCGPCRKELKEIGEVKQTELADVEIVFISDETTEKIKALKETTTYPVVFLKLNTTLNSIGIHSIPTSYIVNTKMEVKEEKVGYIDWTDPSTAQHYVKLIE